MHTKLNRRFRTLRNIESALGVYIYFSTIYYFQVSDEGMHDLLGQRKYALYYISLFRWQNEVWYRTKKPIKETNFKMTTIAACRCRE